MKKRICVTIPNLHGAGCERMLSEVLPYFSEAFDVDLVLQEKKVNYLLPSDVNVIVLGVKPDLKSTLLTVSRLRRLQKDGKYDAIVSYLDLYNATVWLSRLFWRGRPPHIAVEQTTDREFFAHSRMSAVKQWIFKLFLKLAYPRVDHIIALSNNLAGFLSADLGIKTPITVIHNGVDPEKFNLDPPAVEDLARHFLDAELRVLCISRLDYQKNIPFLLESFAQVAQQNPAARLFILGAGPDEEEFGSSINERGLSGNVFLLGFQPNPEDYLKACDLFVLSSRYESFGNVIVEAMACGVPIVTTNYGGAVFEIITNERLGTIVEQGESDIFAAAILDALENQKNFDRNRSHEYAIKNFAISNKAEEYVRTVARAIKRT